MPEQPTPEFNIIMSREFYETIQPQYVDGLGQPRQATHIETAVERILSDKTSLILRRPVNADYQFDREKITGLIRSGNNPSTVIVERLVRPDGVLEAINIAGINRGRGPLISDSLGLTSEGSGDSKHFVPLYRLPIVWRRLSQVQF